MSKSPSFDFIKCQAENEFSFFTHLPFFLQNLKISQLHLDQFFKNYDLIKAKYKRTLPVSLKLEELNKSIEYLKSRY